MKRIIFVPVLLTFVCCSNCYATLDHLTLKTAMDKGLVTLTPVSLGGYDTKGLSVNIQNNTAKPMSLSIDPGLIFRPSDTSYQDLVIVGEETIVVTGKSRQDIILQTFCAKSYASCPSKGLPYAFLKQGDSVMIKVLHFIKQYALYDGLGQSAIWALTDHHNLEGVFDGSRAELGAKFVKYMASLTGMPEPDVYKTYSMNEVPGAPAFVPKVLKMYAKFEWITTAPKTMSVGIYNETGELIQPVEDNREYRKGGHRMTIEFEAENVKSGKYYIRVMEGTSVMKEQMVKVD